METKPATAPAWAHAVSDSLQSQTGITGRRILHLPGSSEFLDSENDYFTAAACEVQSAAVARPTSTTEVSALLKSLRRHLPPDTPIAVRGAGHATYGGTAKAKAGVTIDMRGLRGVNVLPDETVVRISAGETWASVYTALESRDIPLTTVGGRMPSVGVIGFLLGGGISSFSARFGFGADMVVTWEVVTASGEVVRAGRNDSETSDLWDALRGGSTNFGIVTAVEITCFAHPAFFRGTNVFYLPIARQATLKALVEVGCAPFPADSQPVSHAMWCITQFHGMKFINALLTTTGSPKQVRMDGFTSVWGRIPLTGRLGDSSHGKFIEEQGKLAPKNGSRTIDKTITVKLDLTLLNAIVDLWYTSVESMHSVSGLMHTLVLQPLSVGMLNASCGTTPMSLPPTTTTFQGLNPRDGPLVVVELCMTWHAARDDDFVLTTGIKFLEDIVVLAQQMGLAHPFIFPNYAWPTEAVIASYGQERLQFLKKVATRWDPEGFFQQQFTGGFKIDR